MSWIFKALSGESVFDFITQHTLDLLLHQKLKVLSRTVSIWLGLHPLIPEEPTFWVTTLRSAKREVICGAMSTLRNSPSKVQCCCWNTGVALCFGNVWESRIKCYIVLSLLFLWHATREKVCSERRRWRHRVWVPRISGQRFWCRRAKFTFWICVCERSKEWVMSQ